MEYSVVYSSRRTVGLSIKDGKLIVRAPYNTSLQIIEKILNDHNSWIVKHLEKSQTPKLVKSDLNDDEEKRLRSLAKNIIPAKVDHYANIMGLKLGRIKITNAKTRFGSCSAKGNLSFSLRLMLYPDAAIDYVVVHELAHLVEMNHSARFYKIIERYLPDYKERRKLLKI